VITNEIPDSRFLQKRESGIFAILVFDFGFGRCRSGNAAVGEDKVAVFLDIQRNIAGQYPVQQCFIEFVFGQSLCREHRFAAARSGR
jgi:hypothetical protein